MKNSDKNLNALLVQLRYLIHVVQVFKQGYYLCNNSFFSSGVMRMCLGTNYNRLKEVQI